VEWQSISAPMLPGPWSRAFLPSWRAARRRMLGRFRRMRLRYNGTGASWRHSWGEGTAMKVLAYVLAIVCAVAAIVYFTTQAGSLPTFMPGYAAGSSRIHTTHALAATVAAIVLVIFGWVAGRSRA